MPETGIYFVRGAEGLHIEQLQTGFCGPLQWFAIGSEVGEPEPDGEIDSGPYSVADLHQAAANARA